MNFKKKFDYSDVSNFLSDNYTLGNADYYENKFHNKLPMGFAQIMEAETREEYTEEDVKKVVESVQNYNKYLSDKLMKEYEERALEGLMDIEITPKTDDKIIIVDDTKENISTNNNNTINE